MIVFLIASSAHPAPVTLRLFAIIARFLGMSKRRLIIVIEASYIQALALRAIKERHGLNM